MCSVVLEVPGKKKKESANMLNISSSCHIYFIYFSNIFSYENYFVKYLKTVVLLFQATLFSVLNKLFSNLSETGHS